MTAFSSQVDSGVGHLVFNKPPVNAFDSSEWAAIAAEIRALGQRNDVHVLVISAEGRGFCAGANLQDEDRSERRDGAGGGLRATYHPILLRSEICRCLW